MTINIDNDLSTLEEAEELLRISREGTTGDAVACLLEVDSCIRRFSQYGENHAAGWDALGVVDFNAELRRALMADAKYHEAQAFYARKSSPSTYRSHCMIAAKNLKEIGCPWSLSLRFVEASVAGGEDQFLQGELDQALAATKAFFDEIEVDIVSRGLNPEKPESWSDYVTDYRLDVESIRKSSKIEITENNGFVFHLVA